MKTTKQVTVTETLCDECGKPTVFANTFCIVCGKYFCQLCDKRVFYDFKTPAYFHLSGYGSCQSPYVRACPGCKSEITVGMKRLKEIVERWESDREYYNERYSKLANRIFSLVDKRENEIESK